MSNPRKTHAGKSRRDKSYYLQGLKRQAVVPATYFEEEDLSTDSTLKVDEYDTTQSSQERRYYNPRTKYETFVDLLKTHILQITVSIISTVVAAIIILLSINLNREVGEIAQKVNFNEKTIIEIKEEIKEINRINDQIHKHTTDIEVLKERISNLKNGISVTEKSRRR